MGGKGCSIGRHGTGSLLAMAGRSIFERGLAKAPTSLCKTMVRGWQFWIDRGGTFTDVVARSPHGEILTHKLLSHAPERYRDAALAAIRHFLGVAEKDPIPTE